jgi:prefoldin alpha subunit
MGEVEDKVQTLASEMRLLENRLNEINSQRDYMFRALVDAKTGVTALNGLDESSPSDILVPLGGGLFINAETPAADKLLVRIGADVIIEKNRIEAINYLEDRVKGMENAVAGIDAQRKDISNKINERRELINDMISKQQG